MISLDEYLFKYKSFFKRINTFQWFSKTTEKVYAIFRVSQLHLINFYSLMKYKISWSYRKTTEALWKCTAFVFFVCLLLMTFSSWGRHFMLPLNMFDNNGSQEYSIKSNVRLLELVASSLLHNTSEISL